MSSRTAHPPTARRWIVAMVPMVVLLGLSAWELSGRTFASVAPAARVAEIRRAFSAIPMRLGPWIGSDVPLPAGAREVLHATDTLSRRYIRVGGGGDLTLALVHCGDARDMLGHFPPACYPSQGWQLVQDGGESIVPIEIGGLEGRAALYRFSKPEREGQRSAITVVGTFLMPGERPTPDASALRGASVDRRVSAQGVGQLQFVFGGSPEPADIASAVDEIMDAIPREAIETLLGVASPGAAEGAP